MKKYILALLAGLGIGLLSIGCHHSEPMISPTHGIYVEKVFDDNQSEAYILYDKEMNQEYLMIKPPYSSHDAMTIIPRINNRPANETNANKVESDKGKE